MKKTLTVEFEVADENSIRIVGTAQQQFEQAIELVINENKQLQAELEQLKNRQKKAIPLIKKALLLIYDTMHPMPKAAISSLLTQIEQTLKREPYADKN